VTEEQKNDIVAAILTVGAINLVIAGNEVSMALFNMRQTYCITRGTIFKDDKAERIRDEMDEDSKSVEKSRKDKLIEWLNTPII